MTDHPISVPGFDSLRDLANFVGDLRYDKLTEFLCELESKLREDAAIKHAEHRPRLMTLVGEASDHLDRASISLGKAAKLPQR